MSDLETKEKEKYNYLVERHGFGKDPDRQKHITKMVTSYGAVSEKYLDILKSCQGSSVLEIGVGPGTFMQWLKEEHKMKPVGVDISDKMISYAISLFPEMANDMHVTNAANLSMFNDNTFEIVQHLDGMEHIPVEWELQCVEEAVRVSSKYIVYNNACGDAWADHWAHQGGHTSAHINVKKADEWSTFYSQHADSLGYSIVCEVTNHADEYVVILKKS
jgi:ubiquinone/menaquinone biosynthesis C-methylase UbiE